MILIDRIYCHKSISGVASRSTSRSWSVHLGAYRSSPVTYVYECPNCKKEYRLEKDYPQIEYEFKRSW